MRVKLTRQQKKTISKVTVRKSFAKRLACVQIVSLCL